MNFIKLGILAFLSVALISCEKDDDKDDAQFNITSITAGTEYKLGDTVFIKGTISSKEELHGFKIEIKNSSANDTIVFKLENSNISKAFTVDTFWINDVKAHSDMLFMAFADDDEEEDDDELVIPFHCHPM